MDIKYISGAIKLIEDAQYNINKFRIFEYDTLDEADPKQERIRSDVTVEIGGPSTHIKFTVLTRQEHTMIKDVITTIFLNRLDSANLLLRNECEKLLDQHSS